MLNCFNCWSIRGRRWALNYIQFSTAIFLAVWFGLRSVRVRQLALRGWEYIRNRNQPESTEKNTAANESCQNWNFLTRKSKKGRDRDGHFECECWLLSTALNGLFVMMNDFVQCIQYSLCTTVLLTAQQMDEYWIQRDYSKNEAHSIFRRTYNSMQEITMLQQVEHHKLRIECALRTSFDKQRYLVFVSVELVEPAQSVLTAEFTCGESKIYIRPYE